MTSAGGDGQPVSAPDEALRAWFLGPRGENAALVERLMLDALRDHVFWRRNHHPEDGFTIREADRRLPGYDEAVARLTEEFHGLLAALKQDVPFFSGRYQGHMLAEQTIASQVGYLAGMLYNPNNVVAEVSPVTTRLELEVAQQLAAMIGYDPASCWGHITSGGTVANFQGIWTARGVRYLPVSLALAARRLEVAVLVRLPDGQEADLRELPLWSLLNIGPAAALDAYDEFHRLVPAVAAKQAIEDFSLAAIGYQDYTRRLELEFADPLPASVVLVSSTAHYSWEKIVRALGIGSRRLVEVPVDRHARMDTGALEEIVTGLAEHRTPITAVVSVLGTTEEGAVDRLDEVVAVRDRVGSTLGVTFHLHGDACFGGYAAALTRATDGRRLGGPALRERSGTSWPSDGWVAGISALAEADSISIDPHKLGYIPYPAGVFLVRDRRSRNLVSLDPPYLSPAAGQSGEGFIGRWILEGSKPGAAAAAVWLSHRVVPLTVDGYGHLLERTAAGARRLHAALGVEGALGAFRAVRLPEPDLNVVCWVVTHPALTTLNEINRLNEAIHRRMSAVVGDREPAYWVSRTRHTAPGCDGIVLPLLDDLGVGREEWSTEGLVVLRSTVMDPFFIEGAPTPDHCTGLVAAIAAAAAASH